jgi:hypothetical protein
MKLNKAEKFVKRQFETGKTRNQVREAIFEKLQTWNFPPEYREALAKFDPLHDTEPLQGTWFDDTYLDDYICEQCGNGHETCFCGDDVEPCTFCLGNTCECETIELNALPEPGSSKWESMVDDMRREIEYLPIIMNTKKIVESKRKCLDCGEVWYINEDSTGYCEKCGSANVKTFDFMEEFEKWKEKKNDPQR